MYILRVIICFFCLFFSFQSFAQQQEDVIYLKNGWIIRGEITSKNQETITIKTQDRNVFVFKIDEILNTNKEDVPPSFNLKEKGFFHFTELGPLASQNTGELNVNTSAFSFQTINGLKFNPHFGVGLGVGIDLYATQTFIPAFATIRGDLTSKKQFVPFYFVDYGYGFNGTTNTLPNTSFNGGSVFATGLGLKIGLSEKAGVLISLGYRNQRYGATVNQQTNRDTYNRIALRAGFYL